MLGCCIAQLANLISRCAARRLAAACLGVDAGVMTCSGEGCARMQRGASVSGHVRAAQVGSRLSLFL